MSTMGKKISGCLAVMTLLCIAQLVPCVADAATEYNWTPQEATVSNDLFGVSAGDANNVWAVGVEGAILYYNGTGWQLQGSPSADDLWDVFARDTADVWAVGEYLTILHYNGIEWELRHREIDPFITYLTGVSAADAAHICAVGNRNGLILYSISCGQAWDRCYYGGVNEDYHFEAVKALGTQNFWIVGDGQVISGFGTQWTERRSSSHVDEFIGIDALGESDIWTVGNVDTIWHYNGAGWNKETNIESHPVAYYLEDIRAIDTNNLIAVGHPLYDRQYGVILRYDGSTWKHSLDGGVHQLFSVSSANADYVWAVGAVGTILLGRPTSLAIVPRLVWSGREFNIDLRLVEAITRPFDFYLLADTPYGVYTLFPDGRVESGIHPVVLSVARHPATAMTFHPNIRIPEDMAEAPITFYAVAVDAGKIPPVSNLSGLGEGTPYVIHLGKCYQTVL